MLPNGSEHLRNVIQWQGRTQGEGFGGSTPPIGLSTKMHSKENITFLALLSLLFLQRHGLQHDLKQLLKHLEFLRGGGG